MTNANVIQCGGCGATIPAARRPLECYRCGWTTTDENLPPYQVHSDTSKEAAESVVGSVASLREQVFQCLSKAGFAGHTDEELQAIIGMNPSTERPRRIELVAQGRARDSGLKRKTKSGRSAVVWVAVDGTLL